jgi:hypothetical protein
VRGHAMAERKPSEFVMALFAALVILGLLFWIFLLWFQNSMRDLG